MGNLRKALARFLTTLIVVALTLIPAPQVTMAAPAPWPSDYTPYTTTSGTYIFDPSNDINPQQSDLTSGVMPSGSGTDPTAWAASDGTNVFFRWRISVNPIDTGKGGIDNVAYVVQVAKDGVHKVTVGLDGKSTTTDYVYVVKADNTGMVPIYTPIYSGGTWSGGRATPTSGGTGEYFIEIQVPIAAITALAPDITATTPVQLFFGSSQAANLATINKDFMSGSSVSFAGLASPSLGQGAISVSYASAAVSGLNPPVVYRQTTYDLTLTARNTGLNRIDSVSISDTLPDGVSILNTSTSSGSISSSGQTFTWTPNPIYGGTSTTATIRVAVTPAAAQANTTLTLTNGASGSASDMITGASSSSTANSVMTGIVQNPPPTLTSTSTTLSTRGDEGFTLTLTGADFIPSSVVRINGSDRVTTFVSSTTLQAAITTADLSNAGSKSVTVFNPTPGGGTSSAQTLTVNNPAPAITSIDPPGKLQGASGFTLTVNGTDFIPESVVRLDGGARTTTYVNSTTLQATIPASDLTTVGNRSITVFNPTPGGGSSNAVNLAVYVPGASQVTLSAPPSVQAGAVSSALTLTSRDGGGTATAVSGDTVFHVSSNSLGTAVFYSDAAGTLPVTQVTIPAGQSKATFYYRDSRGGTPTISAARVSGDAVGSATTTITVTNQAPVIMSGETVTVDEGQGLPPVTATDADGDDLTFKLVSGSLPPGVSLDEETGTFTGTVGYEATGPYVVTIEVRDGKGGTDTVTITITVNNVNRNPTLGAIGDRSVNEGTLLSISLSATDSDLPAQALTFTVLSGPGSITGSTYTWTPAENEDGTYNVTIQVEDSLGATDFETFTVTVSEVNTAPVLNTIGGKSVGEGSQLTFTATATDADLVDGVANTLTYSLAGTVPAGATINSSTGVVTWTAPEGSAGTNPSLTIRVTDNGTPALYDEETITITVTETNANPSLGAIGNRSVNEGTLLSISLSATDSDLPAQSLTFTVLSGPGSITGSTYTWTPAENEDGTYDVTIQVEDSLGATDFETFTVTVNEVNTAPVLNAIGGKSVGEGSQLTFTATATDADLVGGVANTLTYSLAGTVPAGAAINSSTGVVTWTAPEGSAGTNPSLTVRVTDNGTPALYDEETITITVTETNANPSLGAIGNRSVNEGTLLSISLSATDSDLPAQSLTFTVLSGPGSITGSTYTWTPAENQDGTYDVTIQVEDSLGATDFETFTVTVNEVNTAPVLDTIGGKSVGEGSQLTFTATATDADLVGGVANTLTYSLAGTVPAGAAINSSTGVVTWTAPEGSAGTNPSLTVRVTDNGTPTLYDEETITISVTDTDTVPALSDIADRTNTENDTVTITLAGTDADGDTLTYSATNLPDGVTLTGNVISGTLSYTSAGTYTVTVTARDPQNNQAIDTFIWTVNDKNRLPGFTSPATRTIAEGSGLGSVTAADADGDNLTYTVTSGALPPGISLNPNGTFTGTASYAAAGDYEVTIQVTDGKGGFVTQTLTITVTATNTTPTLAAIADQTNTENQAVILAVIGADADGDALTYSATGLPDGLSINPATGLITGTLSYNSAGTHIVTVTVKDPANNHATRTFTWRVTEILGTAMLNGTVTNQVTGARLSGANVVVLTQSDVTSTSTATGSDGTYAVAVTEGTFKVRITMTGYQPFETTRPFGPDGHYTINAALVPLKGSVTGLILTDAGFPVSFLRVYLLDAAGEQVAMGISDASGRYLIDPVSAGTYKVLTPNPSAPLAQAEVTIQPNIRSEVNLHLPGKAKLTLTAAPPSIVGDGRSTATLQASLTLRDGTPVSGTIVRFSATAGSLSTSAASTSADGGAYAILTAPQIEGTQPRTEQVRVTVRDEAQGIFADAVITVTFLPASIHGVVTDGATGKPVAGAIVEVNEDFDGDGTIDFSARVTTGPDGRYAIAVPRGNWNYKVQTTAPMTVGGKTIQVKSSQNSQVGQLQGIGETIQANRTVGGQILVVGKSADGPRPAGQVLTQGERIHGSVFSSSGEPLDLQVTIHDDGSFEVNDVEPGEYQVVFQVIAPTGETLAGIRMKIVVNQDGELALNTGLIDPYGIVTDAVTGKPVEGATMKLMWADTSLNRSKGRQPDALVSLPVLPDFAPNQNRVPQVTTAAGEYAWMVWPDGDYYILAQRDGYAYYDSRQEGRNVPAGPGEDGYVQNGIIHVGTTIVEYDLSLTPTAKPPTGGTGGTGTDGTGGTGGTNVTPQENQPAPVPVLIPTKPVRPAAGTHKPYILGYPDGTFGPERSITRAEVATVLARVLELDYTDTSNPGFSDVSAGAWYTGYVNAVRKNGIMIGYPDGSFAPNAPITRAEIATVLARLRGLSLEMELAFADTLGHWSQQYVSAVRKAEIMNGYPDGTFRPERQMTRAEFVTAINRLFNRGPLTDRPGQRFPDVSAEHWARGHVEEASIHHSFESMVDREHWIEDVK